MEEVLFKEDTQTLKKFFIFFTILFYLGTFVITILSLVFSVFIPATSYLYKEFNYKTIIVALFCLVFAILFNIYINSKYLNYKILITKNKISYKLKKNTNSKEVKEISNFKIIKKKSNYSEFLIEFKDNTKLQIITKKAYELNQLLVKLKNETF